MKPDTNSSPNNRTDDALCDILYRVMRESPPRDELDLNELASIAENGLHRVSPEDRDKLISGLLSNPDQLQSAVELHNFVQAQTESPEHESRVVAGSITPQSRFSWLKPVFAIAASVALLSASGLVIELSRANQASETGETGAQMSDSVEPVNSSALGSPDLTLIFGIVCALSLSVAIVVLIVFIRRAKRVRSSHNNEPSVGSEPR